MIYVQNVFLLDPLEFIAAVAFLFTADIYSPGKLVLCVNVEVHIIVLMFVIFTHLADGVLHIYEHVPLRA